MFGRKDRSTADMAKEVSKDTATHWGREIGGAIIAIGRLIFDMLRPAFNGLLIVVVGIIGAVFTAAVSGVIGGLILWVLSWFAPGLFDGNPGPVIPVFATIWLAIVIIAFFGTMGSFAARNDPHDESWRWWW
jgi:hypothetical protein